MVTHCAAASLPILPPPLSQSPARAPDRTLNLLRDLNQLRNAGRADGMALAQQSARRTDRNAAAELCVAVGDQAPAFALPAQADRFVTHKLRWSRGVVKLDKAEVLGTKSRFGIGFARANFGQSFAARVMVPAGAQNARGDTDRFGQSQFAFLAFADEHHRGRAVANGRAHGTGQRLGDHRRREDFLDRHRFTELCPRIE